MLPSSEGIKAPDTIRSDAAPVVFQSLPINAKERKRSHTKVRKFGFKIMWMIGGSAIGLLIQLIAVAANYWLTGNSLESVAGLTGAHVIPLASAVVGAAAGLALASRAQ